MEGPRHEILVKIASFLIEIAQKLPKSAQERPKSAQERPKRPQEAPKRPQEAPKIIGGIATGGMLEAPGPRKGSKILEDKAMLALSLKAIRLELLRI